MNNVGKHHAKKILAELSLDEPPFLPSTAFKMLDIEYQVRQLDGCLGMAMRDPQSNLAGVIVSSSIVEEGRINFTGAHELGHLSIPSHASQSTYRCSEKDLNINNKYLSEKELEANEFAAEWLMPEQIFKSKLFERQPDFDQIIGLKKLFGTSITATTIRVVDLSDKMIMLVVSDSETHKMKYFRKKDDFPYFLNWGSVPDTYVRNPKKGKELPPEFMTVFSKEWFKGYRQPENGEVLEHSIKLTDYPITLTLLLVEN